MKDQKKLIVFTVDEKYFPHFFTALRSFVETNDVSQYLIGLIYSGINEGSISELFDYFHQYDLEISAQEVRDKFTEVNVAYHFNHIIFYRLLAPELFGNYERMLYLDCDIIFVGDVSEIFDSDLNDRVLGAIDKTPFFGVPEHLLGLIDRYLASGLLLINTKNFIANNVRDKCIDFLNTHHYEMPDQDALSYVVQDFLPIDPSYSVETAFMDRTESLFDFVKKTKIIQFSGSSKPWQMNNNHPYKKMYWKYRNKTPYKSYFPDDMSFSAVIRKITPCKFKKNVKKIIGKTL